MRIRILTAALAAFFMLPFFSMTAYAGGGDSFECGEPLDAVMAEQPQAEVDAPTERPFTPSGTGTVIDYATESYGKAFYTIMTPDKHAFYLVIDKQRNTENVYFLNAVTIADLAVLAEIPEQPQAEAAPPPPTDTNEQPPNPAPEPERGGGMGTYIIIIALALLGGGAGWYFKVYHPKQQGAESGDEYEPPVNEYKYPDDWGDGQGEDGDNSSPWYEEDGESEVKE